MGKPRKKGGDARHAHQEASRRKKASRQEFRKNKQKRQYGDASWKQAWNKFSEQLAVQGLYVKDVAGDGNCYFRAVADQMEGQPNKHPQYRKRIVDFIKQQREEFEPFIEDDQPFDDYVDEMGKQGTWGGHLEIQATSLVYNANIAIHQLDQPRWELKNFDGKTRTIHISYHDGDHYASVRRRDEPANYDGPPYPININQDDTKGSNNANTNKKKKTKTIADVSPQEQIIAESTGCYNYTFIRAVLQQTGYDPDAAVDFILVSGMDEDFQRDVIRDSGLEVSVYTIGDDFEEEEEEQPWEKYKREKENKEKVPKKGAKGKEKEHKEKPSEKAVTTTTTTTNGGPPVHPKLLKFNQEKLSNKERHEKKRQEKEKELQPALPPQDPPPMTVPPTDVPDLGSLQI